MKTICKCCDNSLDPGETCAQCGQTGERAITRGDILKALQQHIITLNKSFRVRIPGPHKGKIMEPNIRFEIRCIEAAIKIVMESEGV